MVALLFQEKSHQMAGANIMQGTAFVEKWTEFYESLSESDLEAIALLRVIECTNGCIQHAYRENDERALSVDDTRKAMNFSMTAMKNLKFSVGPESYEFKGIVAEKLREARELYVRAFKRNEENAMNEFFDCSIACAKVLGLERIKTAKEQVETHLADTFPQHTVSWGANYLAHLIGTDSK